jgi:hypothetical protein
VLEHVLQRAVERAGVVALGGRDELVLEAEAIEESAQDRVVVVREALVPAAEGVGDAAQRLAEVGRQHVRVGHVVGYFAQSVHVVAEGDQPRRRAAADDLVSAADQRGAQDFLERADMRQARGAIAGLEQHRLATRLAVGVAFDELHRLLERPGLGHAGGCDQGLVNHRRAFAEGERPCKHRVGMRPRTIAG